MLEAMKKHNLVGFLYPKPKKGDGMRVCTEFRKTDFKNMDNDVRLELEGDLA